MPSDLTPIRFAAPPSPRYGGAGIGARVATLPVTRILAGLAAWIALLGATSSASAADASTDAGAPEQSVGAPDLGHLLRGRRLKATRRVRLRFPTNTWGTTALIDGIHGCVDAVHRKHGRSHALLVGDLSRKSGGMLRPHEGHQNGREADVGFFMRSGKPLPGLWRLAAQDLDAARTLTFLECWIESGSLLRVFLDRSLQAPLVREAQRRGWSAETIHATFSYPRPGHERVGLIQHRSHHDNHLHLRLRCADHEPRCVDKPYGAKARRAMARGRTSPPRQARRQPPAARVQAKRATKPAARRAAKRATKPAARRTAKRATKPAGGRAAKRATSRGRRSARQQRASKRH